MHHIYHTDSFILSSRPTGEDSKTVVLYTRELGLVHARAQALRKLSSKLRYTLQDFSRANVDLVRGKEVWRITTAVSIDTHSSLRKNLDAERVFARVCSLVTRLCAGEDPNEVIFSVLENGIVMVYERSASIEALRDTELFLVAKTLIALGYLSRDFFAEADRQVFTIPASFTDPAVRRNVLAQINQALSATQL